MEVWQDYQTGKFFSVNKQSGRQSPSNRFGSEKSSFSPYSTGFSRLFQGKDKDIDKVDRVYAVQPEKFDGYCQYPRPLQKATSNRSPFVRSNVASSKLLIKQKEKIPVPLKYMELSQNRSFTSSKNNCTSSLPARNFKTLEDLKTQEKSQPLTEMKTVSDLSQNLEIEKRNKSGYLKSKPKTQRRRLKGYFFKQFKTSAELSKEEEKVTRQTNPKFYEKIHKKLETDYLLLQKSIHLSRKMDKIKHKDCD
jgi:hypothetical protein